MNKELISTSEIAALADVDVSTVSNWRRRFDGSFPEPAFTDDGGKRPRFNRAEIVDWLSKNPQVGSRRSTDARGADAVFDLLRGHLPINQALDVVGHLLASIVRDRKNGTVRQFRSAQEIRDDFGDEDLSGRFLTAQVDEMGHVPDTLLEGSFAALAGVEHPLDVYDRALYRQVTRVDESSAQTTPAALSEFLISLAEVNPRGVVYDPAAGYGGLLTEAIKHGRGSSGLGVEIDASAAVIAERRAFLAGADVSVRVGDSLLEDPSSGLEADLVLADPPLGIALRDRYLVENFPWEFGTPKASNADMAWLQHAVAHLKPGGRAIVVTAIGALFQQDRATSHIRNEMIRRGAVHAVFALPSRMRLNTSIRLAVWVLGAPDLPDRRTSVLLVDAGADDRSTVVPGGRIVSSFHAWAGDENAPLDASFAVAVPVTELLAPEATLLPSRWTANPVEDLTAKDWKESADAGYREAQSAIEQRWTLPAINLDDSRRPVKRVSVGDLAKAGELAIVRGRHAERADEVTIPTYPILTVKQARPGARLDDSTAERVIISESTTSQLVRPGDVLVYLDGEDVKARLWSQSGWVLGRFMQVVRLNTDRWDAHYFAAAINNPVNERFIRGGAIRTHFDLKDFEVAEQPLPNQRAVAAIASRLGEIAAGLREASDQVAAAEVELSNALTSGSIVASTR